MPLVSVIMPVKNAGPWITDCVASIQCQSLEDWELIAVNDGSSDNSVDILRKSARSDTRIRLLQNPGHGIVPALVAGHAASTGRFIARMDADDLMPAKKLETLHGLLANAPENTVATGKVEYFSENRVSPGYKGYALWLNERCDRNDHWQHLYRECTIASPNWMMERKTFEKCGGFVGLEYPEDYDLAFRWYADQVTVRATRETTHLWREHPLRTSRTSHNYNQQAFFRLKLQRFLELESLPGKQVVVWGKNKKAQLVRQEFNKKQKVFCSMDESNFKEIEKVPSPLLLVCAYPGEDDRRQIEAYLSSIGMECGRNWWWT